MKIANNLLFPLCLFGLIQCVVLPALAVDNYKTFRRDVWEFEAATQFYKTEANFTSAGGSYSKLNSGNYFQQIDLTVGSRFVSDRDFALFGYFNTGISESSSNGTVRNNSAPASALAGMEYLVYSESFQVVPEFAAVFPFETYKNSGDSVMNNEGVIELRPAVTVQSDFSGSYLWFVKAGFSYRDQGRSYLLPWHVGGEMKLPSSRLGARVYGFQSITDDKDTSTKSARLAASDNVNGGSLHWYAVNPSVISGEAYYRFRIADGWVGQVHGGLDVTGTNYSSGFYVGAFVRYAFDISSWYRDTPTEYQETKVNRPEGQSQMYRESIKKPEPQFKEDTNDGVDQKIFRIKPVTPNPSSGELQQELQDAEMKVKLRSNKKSKRKK